MRFLRSLSSRFFGRYNPESEDGRTCGIPCNLLYPVILATGLISDIEANTGIVDSMQSDSSIDTGSGQDQVSQIVDAMDIKALFSGMVVGEDLLEYVAQLVNNIYDIVNRCAFRCLFSCQVFRRSTPQFTSPARWKVRAHGKPSGR